jgi:lipopolysaccharide export system permease protein
MGKTLRNYLIGEIGGAFLAGLAIFTFVLLIARILELVDLVLARGVPGSQVIQLFGYILPSFLELTIPMALLLSIVVGFGRLATDGELTAMRAAGLSLVQLMGPVLLFSALVAASTLVLGLDTRPWANRQVNLTIYEIAKTRATAALKPQVFNSTFGGMVIYVDSIEQDSGLMKGILVSDERESYRRTTIFSQAGRLVTNEDVKTVYLQLLDGTSLSYHAGQESYDKTDFESLEVNLDLEDESGRDRIQPTLQPGEMTWEQLQQARHAKIAVGDSAIEEGIEIQRKFVLSAAALILPFIGVPLGIPRSRAVRARSFGVSITVILTYYFALSGAMTLIRREAVSLEVGMWAPNVVLALVGLFLFARAARDGRIIPRRRTRRPRQ